MGVRGLYTYVDKLYKEHNMEHKVVNILDEIKNYRLANKKRKPVIIVDLWTMARNMQISAGDVVVGFRLNTIRDRFEDFLKKLTAAGAKLVFVFEKTQVNNKDFYATENENYSNGCVVAAASGNFDSASRSLEDKIDRVWNFNIPLNRAVMLALSQVAPNFGEMLGMNSINYELAAFNVFMAKKRKAMAILSLNTHYLFYDAEWQFWSDADLDMQAMTVRQYNRREVLKILDIPQEKASLFIALSESFRASRTAIAINDRISAERLVTFVRQQKYPIAYKKLSKAVQTTFRYCPSSLEDYLPRAERRFDETNTFAPRGFREIMKIIKNDFGNYAEEMLVNSRIYISPVYFDLSQQGPSLRTHVVMFMERTSGILVKNSSDRKPRQILVKTNSDGEIVPQKVVPIIPGFEVAPLQTLISGDWPEEEKWKLLLWITNYKLNVAELQKIPKEFLFDVIVCLHLIKSRVMKLPEAECLLLSIVEAHEAKPSNEYPQAVNSHVFYLGMWYQKVFFILHSCLGAVGLKCFQGQLMFDGSLFQKIYAEKNAINASCRRSLDDLEILERLVLVTTNKSVKIFKSRKSLESPEVLSALELESHTDNIPGNRNSKSTTRKIENNFEELASTSAKSTRRVRKDDLKI